MRLEEIVCKSSSDGSDVLVEIGKVREECDEVARETTGKRQPQKRRDDCGSPSRLLHEDRAQTFRVEKS